MAATKKSLADLICERLLPEKYQANHLRKNTSKIRPLGCGRTPLEVGKWQRFDAEVRAWWRTIASRKLALIQMDASQTYPKVFPRHGVISSKKDGVRAALQLCVFEPVNLALSQGLELDFLLNETESIACVKSNVDWGGFLIKKDQGDIFVRIALPIGIKPPWQFMLSAVDGHLVDLLLSCDPMQRDKVRFSLAQVFLYMILEDADFGVLCSKEQYVFLERRGKPEDRRLLISRTFDCQDEIGIRKCLLYMCARARVSLAIPEGIVDNAEPTPLADECVAPFRQSRNKKRKGREFDRFGKKKKLSKAYTSCVQDTSVDKCIPLKVASEVFEKVKDLEPSMLSARASVKLQTRSWKRESTSWRREFDGELDPITWFKNLPEFDIFSLELGKVLSSAGKVIVREGNVWGVRVAIKMFDFIDSNELLQEFYNEVKAYDLLESVQGEATPRLLAYGSLWGHYMGFLALTLEGQQMDQDYFQSQPHLIEEAMKSLKQIHAANILHNDVAFRNMVLSATTGKIMFIDFGRCLTGVDEEDYLEELEYLEELLHG